MPLVVIAAFAIDAATGGNSTGPSDRPLPAISASAPPNITSEAAACTKVLEKLPVQLGKLAPRVVHTNPDTPFVVAWGDPAVLLSCGVARPKDLHADSGAMFISATANLGPFYDVTADGGANVYTTVDRAAYISISIPGKYNSGPLPQLSKAIAQALPAVCSTNPKDPLPTLCTRRK